MSVLHLFRDGVGSLVGEQVRGYLDDNFAGLAGVLAVVGLVIGDSSASAGVANSILLNSAFTLATSQGIGVLAPPGTIYIANPLLFGTQNSNNTGSNAPAFFKGAGAWSTVFKATAGFNGIMFQAWSLAGREISDLQFDASNVSNVTAYFHVQWVGGAGPSCQNTFRNIRGVNPPASSAIALMNFDNQNDSTINKIASNGATHAGCTWSMVASGGVADVRDIIWNGGFAKFGCQNGKIGGNSWGMGIQFAQGCLNYIHLDSVYLYANSSASALIWSESFASQQSFRALTLTACQLITALVTPASIFNVNAYSTIDLTGCELIGTGVPFLAATSRRDSFQNVRIRRRGGSHSGGFTFNQLAGFTYDKPQGFLNDSTGFVVPNENSSNVAPVNATLVGAGTPAYTARAIAYDSQNGNTDIECRVTWTGATAGSPLTINLPVTTQVSGSTVGINFYYNGLAQALTGLITGNVLTFFVNPGGAVFNTPASGDFGFSACIPSVI